MPILALPESIAFLVMMGKWTDLVILASWHQYLCDPDNGARSFVGRPLFRIFHWPPQDSLVWQTDLAQTIKHEDIPELNAAELTVIADQIRRWGAGYLHAAPGDVEVARQADQMRLTIARLQSWASSMAEVEGAVTITHIVPHMRWRQSCMQMLDAIRY